jgi:hypothetical protein
MRGANSHSKWEWTEKMSSDGWIAKEEVKRRPNGSKK